MKLSLLTEWIFAENGCRDEQLYKDYEKIRNRLVTKQAVGGKMSIVDFQQTLDDLERFVFRITIDRDNKEQWQKDQVQNLLEQIAEARKISSPTNIFKFVQFFTGIIVTLMKR